MLEDQKSYLLRLDREAKEEASRVTSDPYYDDDDDEYDEFSEDDEPDGDQNDNNDELI